MPKPAKTTGPDWQAPLIDQLKNGGICMAPSSTGWGWIADPAKVDAARWNTTVPILEGEELVMLVANDAMVNRLCPDLPEQGWDLLDLTERPLNLVVPMPGAQRLLTDYQTATVALRVEKESDLAHVLFRYRQPLLFYPLAKGKEAEKAILQLVDYAVISPPAKAAYNKPSTIRLSNNGEIKIIRN